MKLPNPPQVIRSVKDYQVLFKTFQHKKIGFVPTMGALHEGHLELARNSLLENDVTICSIFVNPTQFNNSEDLAKYPMPFAEDLKQLTLTGVDYLFYPDYQELYPDQFSYKIEEKEISKKFCGAYRPGHFDGVLTVVMKLLNIIRPQRVYMGEKDFQQLRLIQGMAEAFFMNIEIIGIPTVRDHSGLALSSRNTRLSQQGLQKARVFAKILKQDQSLEKIERDLKEENIAIEYLNEFENRKLAAVYIEGVRLIDNVEIHHK